MEIADTILRIRENARAAEALHEQSRRLLVDSVRAGAAAGLTQREISEAIGRSQPEVSRLLRFHGRTELGRKIVRNRAALLKLLSAGGAQNVRVFGSVSRGEDGPASDVDLLVEFREPLSLFALARLESSASELLDASVDIVPTDNLRANVAERARAEAVPL